MGVIVMAWMNRIRFTCWKCNANVGKWGWSSSHITIGLRTNIMFKAIFSIYILNGLVKD